MLIRSEYEARKSCRMYPGSVQDQLGWVSDVLLNLRVRGNTV